MKNKRENNRFNISRRDGGQFKRFQVMVKLMRNGQTEHHNLEVFANGPHQLLEMRRIYTCLSRKINYSAVFRLIKNN